MPPRCSAHPGATADAEPCDALAVLPLALPHALAQRIWRSLPCDVRLRCREVCPTWRDALAEPRLWTELDLTATSGVVARLTPALLLAAAARAGGQLERLLVIYSEPQFHAALLLVFAANMDTLRRLRLECAPPLEHNLLYAKSAELLRAVPRQCIVEADVAVRYEDAGQMLRNEPPFESVSLLSIQIVMNGDPAVSATDMCWRLKLRRIPPCED